MTHAHTDAAEKSSGKSKSAATPQQTREAPTPAAVGPKERHDQVAEAAYFRAEQRGFLPGYELQDWLDAEAELDQPLTQASQARLFPRDGLALLAVRRRYYCAPQKLEAFISA